MVRIDDEKLIELLLKNSKVKYTELAREFSVSETAIRKRIKSLEKRGVIKGYSLKVDLKKLGYEIRALIGIDTKPEKMIEVLEKLKNDDRIKRLYTSSGDHMIMIDSWFKNSREMIDYVKELDKIDGITKICPATIIEQIK